MFPPSPRAQALLTELQTFLTEEVYPAEAIFEEQTAHATGRRTQPPILEELKRKARDRGLWNLFLPWATSEHKPLSNLDYAPIAELTGRSPFLAPESLNCSAPDTGNMELLTLFGTPEQKERWLTPLLAGEIRSSYAMTEPGVASSDASNIRTTIEDHGDHWLLKGHKWWISGANRDRCQLLIVMGMTHPDGARHQRHSLVLVPREHPGVVVYRDLSVMGYNPYESHVELFLRDVRVPKDNLLGDLGAGFAMAQARLGPGRIHHCMRLIGSAERALDLMIERASERSPFGKPLVERGVIQEWIAEARISIDQARLYTLNAAHLMDTVGNRVAAGEISGIKVAVPAMAARVVDRAIQAHGAMGLCQDTPLARLAVETRILRIADGPDEVHRRAVARAELRRRGAGGRLTDTSIVAKNITPSLD